jgi:hypothetical protein
MIIKQIFIELIFKFKFLILILLNYNNIYISDFFENSEEKSTINTAATAGSILDEKTIDTSGKEEKSNITDMLKKEHKVEELGERENNTNIDNLSKYSKIDIEKERLKENFDDIKKTLVGSIITSGGVLAAKTPNTAGKITIATASAIAATSAVLLTNTLKYKALDSYDNFTNTLKHKVLDSYDDFTNDRPPSPSPGQDPFN